MPMSPQCYRTMYPVTDVRPRSCANRPTMLISGLGIVLFDAIMLLKIVAGAKQLDICCGKRATTLRVRHVVIEM